MIDAHKADVANGFLEDWDGISQFWVGQEPTENQVMMFVQNGYKPIYDKRDASVLIDFIILTRT